MNKYVVTVHIPVKAEPGYFEDDEVEYSRSYMEDVEADCFEAGYDEEDILGNSLKGIRFFTGGEMVAFYDASLRLSVVKILDEGDDERE